MAEAYPSYMSDSIRKVEASRSQRLQRDLTELKMPEEEHDSLLNRYHPDYRTEQFAEVRVGPNKGDVMPREIVKLLEAYPTVRPEEVNLDEIDYDVEVLIIGGGGGGTVAALWAVEQGIPPEKVLIVTKLRHGDANSLMAQGGTQAATAEEDSPVQHYLDTMGGGHFENKPELVKALTEEAPMIIEWHRELGVMYDRDENGNMMVFPGGGSSRKRLHCAEDYTGMEQMRVIRDQVRNLGIPVLEFTPAIELLTTPEGAVGGALLWNLDTHQYYVVRAKTTILSTGGFGRLHIQGFPTTNHYGATADGLVMAYRAGAKLRDMDSVQYHPTGAAYPQQILGLLITEKIRGLGGQPVNKEGEVFVFPLEPRDVEAARLIKECEDGKGMETPYGVQGIWLDTPLIDAIHGEGAFARAFPSIARLYKRHDIDPTEFPILVYPTLHYQNGGIEINGNTESSTQGLLAAGEVSGGVHGKNRLMGNSTLDYNVFGRRAGIQAAERAQESIEVGELTLDHARRYTADLEQAGIDKSKKSPLILPEYRGKRTLNRLLDFPL